MATESPDISKPIKWTLDDYEKLLTSLDQDCFLMVTTNFTINDLIALETVWPGLSYRIDLAFKQVRHFRMLALERDIRLVRDSLLRCSGNLQSIDINGCDSLKFLHVMNWQDMLTVKGFARDFPNVKSFGQFFAKENFDYLANYAEQLNGSCKLNSIQLALCWDLKAEISRLLEHCSAIEYIRIINQQLDDYSYYDSSHNSKLLEYLHKYLKKSRTATLKKIEMNITDDAAIVNVLNLINLLDQGCLLKFNFFYENFRYPEDSLRKINNIKNIEKHCKLIINRSYNYDLTIIPPSIRTLPMIKELQISSSQQGIYLTFEDLVDFGHLERLVLHRLNDSIFTTLNDRNNLKNLKSVEILQCESGQEFSKFIQDRGKELKVKGWC